MISNDLKLNYSARPGFGPETKVPKIALGLWWKHSVTVWYESWRFVIRCI